MNPKLCKTRMYKYTITGKPKTITIQAKNTIIQIIVDYGAAKSGSPGWIILTGICRFVQ